MLDKSEYILIGPYEINTVDKNTLITAYIGSLGKRNIFLLI